MGFTSTLPLTIFLFFIPLREVICNLLNTEVSSNGVLLSWDRQGEWTSVGVYFVVVTRGSVDVPVCSKMYTCFEDSCSFDSETCYKVSPCSSLTAVVEGGGYRESVQITTAPKPVTNLQVRSAGTGQKRVEWETPNSKCLEGVMAKVTFNDYYYDYYEELTPTQDSIVVPTCMKGAGYVEVTAVGGSGESEGVGVKFNGAWTDSVQIDSCSPSECTDLTLTWKYKKVCHDVSYVEIELEEAGMTTNLTDLEGGEEGEIRYTGLDSDAGYNTCISGMNEDGDVLARECVFCEVQREVVRSLTADVVTNHTATLTWYPPACPKPQLPMSYEVSYGPTNKILTNGTSLIVEGLKGDSAYEFCVRVYHSETEAARTDECVGVTTLPEAVKYVNARVYKGNSLFVTWPSDPQVNNRYIYIITWYYTDSTATTTKYTNYTLYSSYTIQDYNHSNEPREVCVEVVALEDGRRSYKTCTNRPYPNFHPGRPDRTNMIVSVCVSAALAILISVVLVVVAVKEGNYNKN